MDRPRRDSLQHNRITVRGQSQLTSATKSAKSGNRDPFKGPGIGIAFSVAGRCAMKLPRRRFLHLAADKVTLLWRKGLSMTSIQSIAVTMVFGLGLAFVPAAWADPASDACAALVDARSALYSMMNAKDKSAQDALNAKVQAASTKLDSVLAGMTDAHAKVAADFKAVWDQFKATREKEIIPAIYKGDADDAKKITNGIQSERLSKMWDIMSCKVR